MRNTMIMRNDNNKLRNICEAKDERMKKWCKEFEEKRIEILEL